MAVIYLKSGTGNNSNTGLDSFANAKATLSAAITAAGAGGTVYVHYQHAETVANGTITTSGTEGQLFFGVNDALQPQDGAVITLTGSFVLINGSATYQNIRIVGNGGRLSTVSGNQCLLENVSVYGRLAFGSTNSGTTMGSNILLRNTNCEPSDPATLLSPTRVNFEWRGGTLLNPTALALSKVIALEGSSGAPCNVLLEGLDLSAGGAGLNIFEGSASGKFVAMNCKMPANWTGGLTTPYPYPGQYFELYNCDSGPTNYRVRLWQWAGALRDETGIVKTGGASDGTTPLSWCIATNAGAKPFPWAHRQFYFKSQDIVVWNDLAGSQLTVSLDVLNDGVTLTNSDVAITVSYVADATSPKGGIVSSQLAQFSAATPYPVSASMWTNTGAMATPVKQKLSVSFTPQQKGPLVISLMVSRPNLTLYVDPKVDVTATNTGGGTEAPPI